MKTLTLVLLLSIFASPALAHDVKDSPDDVAVFLSHVDTNMNALMVNTRDTIHSVGKNIAKATAPNYKDGTVTREIIISEEQNKVLETAGIVCLAK